jgi:hypothetical protein
LDFIGVASDQQNIASGQGSRDQPHRLLPTARSVYYIRNRVLWLAVDLNIGWLPLHITCDPVAVRPKQSDDPDTAWTVPQALVDRLEPLAGWQGNENSYL